MCHFSVWYCIAATSNLLWVSVDKLKMARTVWNLIPPTLVESCCYLSFICHRSLHEEIRPVSSKRRWGLASRVLSVSLQEKCREKEKENSRVISSTFNKLQAYSSCRTGSFWKHLHQAEESRLLGIHHKSWGPERWGLFSDGSTRACKAKSLQDVKKRLLLDVWPWYQWVCEIISWSTKDRRKFDLEWGTFRGVPLSRDLGLYPHRNRSCNTHFLDITYHLLGITHWSLSPRCTDQHKEIVIHFLQHTCLAQSLQCNSGGKNDFCHEFVLWKT